jgi:aspartate aminotransferase-like enzyme
MGSDVPLQARVHRWTLQVIALVFATAVGICLGVASVRAYDVRLDEAIAALQKAAALVEASSPGVVSPRTQDRFDRHREKALADIQDAMTHILAAGAAADADGGVQ